MRTLLLCALALVAVGVVSGCVMAPGPVTAAITVDLKGPMSGYVDNSVKPDKNAMVMAQGVLVVAWGDCSIEAAMKQGGIKKIHHIDTNVTNILGLYAKREVWVYGE
jgi:hypothetical protein